MTGAPGVLEPFRSIDGKLPEESNITEALEAKVGRQLHLRKGHPLHTIKTLIEQHFVDRHGDTFHFADDKSPVVTNQMNFDDLLIPSDHVSRSPHDTYYIDGDHLLRTHTSAHQTELLQEGHRSFLCTGDVFRRDTIDATHSPVFHQMEGVRIWPKSEQVDVVADLKDTLEGVCHTLFPGSEIRWNKDYFPFTDPSLEVEVFYNGDWMEVLGCGKIQPRILEGSGFADCEGWAFGLGLERLAMVLFGIPDIRLFWSEDARFTDQFREGEVKTFVPYSKYPLCYKDVTFWLPEGYHAHAFYELARSVGGDLIEEITEIDAFTHPKTGRDSRCYRVVYRSMDRSLTNDEVDSVQERLRALAAEDLGVELR